MSSRLVFALFSLAALHAQNIFTVAGIPYTHRHDIDGVPALKASLGNVYGLLIDKTTGRLLFNDATVISRIEPDGTYAVLGRNRSQRRQMGVRGRPMLRTRHISCKVEHFGDRFV